MAFDWVGFLTQHNIEFTTTSRYHVTAGNIGIQCPWCADDTGFNLHISLLGRGWHCFRIESHRGVRPQPLIQRLLRCPLAYADSLVQDSDAELVSDRDMVQRLRDLFQASPNAAVSLQTTLRLPESFARISTGGSSGMFVSYMQRRGFSDIPSLCRRYGLHGCTDGSRWHGRIIFPVIVNQKLVTWTGRHVGSSPIRYLTLSVKDAETPAVTTIKHTILWHDMLKQQRGTLVICEGPFDALKINYLGKGKQIFATSIYGKSITEKQRDLLEALDNFDRRIVLLDAGTTDHFNPRGYFASLESRGFQIMTLPLTVKDPGELDAASFSTLFD